MSGSPPVISTTFVPIASTRAMMSSSVIFSPPWNEYSVSHQTQRSGQPVSRTNVHGSPAQVLSPWIEWKISVTRRNVPRAAVGLRSFHCRFPALHGTGTATRAATALTMNNRFAGRSAMRRIRYGYHASPKGT